MHFLLFWFKDGIMTQAFLCKILPLYSSFSIYTSEHFQNNVRDLDSQCTVSLLAILSGPFWDGCQTRQSSFCPFMLRRGWRENWIEATMPSKLRFWLWPERSVSQERPAIGLAIERHVAAGRKVWPSTRTKLCREVMGLAVK